VNLTLRLSGDGGLTWPVSRALFSGSSAYSSLCVLPDNSIGILFEKDNYTKITFVRVEEDWLFDPDADTDADGLPDSWETFQGVSGSAADDDGDGSDNLREYLAGTDPLNPASLFRANVLTMGSAGLQLSWQSVPGRVYQIEAATDLSNWQAAATITAVGSSSAIVLPATTDPRRFFRVRVLR
jgi:hypothetical protein